MEVGGRGNCKTDVDISKKEKESRLRGDLNSSDRANC